MLKHRRLGCLISLMVVGSITLYFGYLSFVAPTGYEVVSRFVALPLDQPWNEDAIRKAVLQVLPLGTSADMIEARLKQQGAIAHEWLDEDTEIFTYRRSATDISVMVTESPWSFKSFPCRTRLSIIFELSPDNTLRDVEVYDRTICL